MQKVMENVFLFSISFDALVSHVDLKKQETFHLTVDGKYAKYLAEGIRLPIWDRDIRRAELLSGKRGCQTFLQEGPRKYFQRRFH